MAGKKEVRKWAKFVKKQAHVHKKEAKRAYKERMSGRCVGAAAAGADAEAQAGQTPQGFDLAAAAHQIQEFLNAAGIPIDVVELYNEWGTSHGTATAAAGANASAAAGTENQQQAPAAAAAENSAPATDAASANANANTNLAEDLQQLHLGTGASAPAAAQAQAPTSTAAAAAVAMDVQGVPAPAAVPGQSPRIYPQLNPAHLQQMISTTVGNIGNAVRNIPIAPWNAPAATATPSSTPVGTAAAAGGTQTGPELGDRLQQTLNQLLSMGFSNHDGWLGRLVASKKGNLEEVLNALFPVGGGGAGAGPTGGDNVVHTLD